MRLRFLNGKQGELVHLAKNNLTWRELAEQLKVSEGYLRNELRHEKRLLSQNIYEKLCQIAGVNFDNFIIEKLNDNWGKSKGGILSPGNTKKIIYPKKSVELAEFYGAMLGDGNSTAIKGKKLGTYMIRIVGDINLDKEYHLDFLRPLMEELFGLKVKVGRYKSNTRFLQIHSREVVSFLKSMGFSPGNKIRNKLRIPNWIKDDRKFLCACLRGLYDTDGGIYKLNNQTTCQICFTSNSPPLLNDVRDSLFSLGMAPSRVTNGNKVYLTKRSELQKFLKEVGFSNPRHADKVKVFNLVP